MPYAPGVLHLAPSATSLLMLIITKPLSANDTSHTPLVPGPLEALPPGTPPVVVVRLVMGGDLGSAGAVGKYAAVAAVMAVPRGKGLAGASGEPGAPGGTQGAKTATAPCRDPGGQRPGGPAVAAAVAEGPLQPWPEPLMASSPSPRSAAVHPRSDPSAPRSRFRKNSGGSADPEASGREALHSGEDAIEPRRLALALAPLACSCCGGCSAACCLPPGPPGMRMLDPRGVRPLPEAGGPSGEQQPRPRPRPRLLSSVSWGGAGWGGGFMFSFIGAGSSTPCQGGQGLLILWGGGRRGLLSSVSWRGWGGGRGGRGGVKGRRGSGRGIPMC